MRLFFLGLAIMNNIPLHTLSEDNLEHLKSLAKSGDEFNFYAGVLRATIAGDVCDAIIYKDHLSKYINEGTPIPPSLGREVGRNESAIKMVEERLDEAKKLYDECRMESGMKPF